MRDNHFAVQATCLSRMRREPCCSRSADKPSTPPEQGALSLAGLPPCLNVTCQDLRSLAYCDSCIPSLQPVLRERGIPQ